MSDETKLMLSGDELAMAADPNIILTKRAITAKAAALFNAVYPAADTAFRNAIIIHPLPVSVMPKISQGENYRGFPYVIMDHPASFEKENIFALRTMFCWGNFISVTLHLSGRYKNIFAEKIAANIVDNLFIAAGVEEWQHHFGADNFVPISSLKQAEKIILFEKAFLKLSLKFDLGKWNEMSAILPEAYKTMAGLLE